MSMLDSFFNNKGFKASKCKTLLKLTIPRIKLLRNKREIHVKQMRRDIAKLLETGQEATARIRVEHIIREEKMMAAQEIIELFCELITVRLPIIETQRECPLDLKEAISSVCFAAPRCADLPELLQAQMLFTAKYGKEFVSAATELMPECGVNRQLVELLSVRAPDPDVKLKLLKEIAEEHKLDWDPVASETELLKPHEDLLVNIICPPCLDSNFLFMSNLYYLAARMDRLSLSVGPNCLFLRKNMKNHCTLPRKKPPMNSQILMLALRHQIFLKFLRHQYGQV
ncbi:hypothetical protein CsSME_00014421 [Camellia sinensis var. sinensis]